MTAETDLLPLPEYFRRDLSHMTWEGLSQAAINYASANVASAVAPLQAEIEALRAEVERVNSWNERVSVCRDHVTDIVDGPCVICALDAAKARADKLEDALRDLEVCANTVDYCYCRRPSNLASALVDLRESAEKARALLRGQEEGHEQ